MLRPDLEALPQRLLSLPVDPTRGYPVPWFVAWVEDKPEFRIMDQAKWLLAIRDGLCWVCGQKLGARMAFVVGPMCSVNRTSAEPPCHLECARWSARNCPFLARPHMVRREDNLPEEATTQEGALLRNPGCTLVWVTRSYRVFNPHKRNSGTVVGLIEMGEPERLEAYSQGSQVGSEVVLKSLSSGVPALWERCDLESNEHYRQSAREALEKDIAEAARMITVMVGEFSE